METNKKVVQLEMKVAILHHIIMELVTKNTYIHFPDAEDVEEMKETTYQLFAKKYPDMELEFPEFEIGNTLPSSKH